MNRPLMTVTITGPRGEEWERATGRRSFPTKTFHPVEAEIFGQGKKEVYLVDVASCEPELQERIAQHLAHRFNGDAGQILRVIQQDGLPVLAEYAFVTADLRLFV